MTDSIKPVAPIVKINNYADLKHRARQIRKVRTNPASYRQGDLDMPITWEGED